MRFDNMTLYYKPTCPFCVKVTSFMDENGIEMEMKNTLEQQNAEELLQLNGKTQVPCLVVDGNPMLESNDIIAFLRAQS